MRSILILFMALVSLSSFMAGDHVVELCHQEQPCEHEMAQSSSTPDRPTAPVHDCTCPSHHTYCSHSPLQISPTQSFAFPSDADLTMRPTDEAHLLSSPDLEGPFQPPKA